MTHIQRLNQEFGLCFGFSPLIDDNGDYVRRGTTMPRFCWRRTRDMFYFRQTNTRVVAASFVHDANAAIILPTIERHSYADMYGDKWCLAYWDIPERDSWPRDFTYPEHGRFRPVENVMLDEGTDPDDFATQAVFFLINQQLTKTQEQTEEELTAGIEKEHAAKRAILADMVDDASFAFDQEPGTKGNVSLPGIV
jgi:hypothetical protein